ncbi:MAG: helix-turn-helix transcriptional regulator, partial [Planctomycetales bacterium]|nr:helix-turn-helix transcriptional regulator [Planctomycetales bacterium]
MNHYRANGERITRLRHVRNWTQERLAAAAGYSERTIRNVESEVAVSLQTLVDIAGTLDVELCEIMTLEEYQSIVKPNRAAVERIIDCLVTKNVDGILNEVADDVVFRYAGPVELPYAGVCHGKE